MLDAWRDCFVGIESTGSLSDDVDNKEVQRLLDEATRDTEIFELGLGTRATNALDKANILTVEDLIGTNSQKLRKMRGVGNRTRREISAAMRYLRKRLGDTGAKNPFTEAGPMPKVLESVTLSMKSYLINWASINWFPELLGLERTTVIALERPC